MPQLLERLRGTKLTTERLATNFLGAAGRADPSAISPQRRHPVATAPGTAPVARRTVPGPGSALGKNCVERSTTNYLERFLGVFGAQRRKRRPSGSRKRTIRGA